MSGESVWTRFVLAALATWRVTHLLASEDGPADIVVRLRARLGRGSLGRVMDCFYCLSLWTAVPAAFLVGRTLADVPVAWVALSGAACLLERMSQKPAGIQPGPRAAEGDVHDGMLWPETHSPPGFSQRDPRAGRPGADDRQQALSRRGAPGPSLGGGGRLHGDASVLGAIADHGARCRDRPAV